MSQKLRNEVISGPRRTKFWFSIDFLNFHGSKYKGQKTHQKNKQVIIQVPNSFNQYDDSKFYNFRDLNTITNLRIPSWWSFRGRFGYWNRISSYSKIYLLRRKLSFLLDIIDLEFSRLFWSLQNRGISIDFIDIKFSCGRQTEKLDKKLINNELVLNIWQNGQNTKVRFLF